jgi:hypothetical protein
MTYHYLKQHPETLEALLLQARRERAEAIHRLIVLPMKRLFARPKLRRAAAVARWSRNGHCTG